MPKLVVVNRAGEQKEVEATAGLSVMEAIRDNGFDELLALCGGQRGDDIGIGRARPRHGEIENVVAKLRQSERILAGVLARTPAHDQTLLGETADDVGERRAVDAGPVDDDDLAGTIEVADEFQNDKLTRRQFVAAHGVRKRIVSSLSRPVQEMNVARQYRIWHGFGYRGCLSFPGSGGRRRNRRRQDRLMPNS